MHKCYDTLIFTTAADFNRLRCNYPRLIQNMSKGNLIFVGNRDVGNCVEEAGFSKRVLWKDEEEILSFEAVRTVIQDILGCDVPRGIVGWYYQQFLKMQYSRICENEYYMVWDGDTVPCGQIEMFDGSGVPYLDLKMEYHEEYFITLRNILPGLEKCVEKSFISEHMLMNCQLMKTLIEQIESNSILCGVAFYEKILRAIRPEVLQENSFSEFETYGTFVMTNYPDSYRLRHWHSFRYGAEFLHPDEMTDADYLWLGKDFDAVTFEKNQFVREDHENLFNNPEYQRKLSARQMLEIAQEEFEEGYLETWET